MTGSTAVNLRMIRGSREQRDSSSPKETFHLPFSLGEIIGERYEISGLIGVGGVGFVVSASDVGRGRPCALKFLRPEYLAKEEVVRRFENEARAAAQIDNLHVVRVFEVGHLPGCGPFMVMELLEGKDLGQLLAEGGALAQQRAVTYALEACEGLAAAHAAGIIHRDVKPENLFLAKQRSGPSTIKLLDFGISTELLDVGAQEAARSLTLTAETVGSPPYMSPEQIRAARDTDPRTDIWSLGCVLYELLTGRAAFDAPSLMQVCASVLEAEPEPPRALDQQIPQELEAVIMRCLAKDRGQRFENVGELAAALSPFAAERARDSVDHCVELLEKSGARPIPAALTERTRDEPQPATRDSGFAQGRWWTPALLLLALAVTTGLAWSITRLARNNARASASAVTTQLAQPATLQPATLQPVTLEPATLQPASPQPATPQPPTEALPTPPAETSAPGQPADVVAAPAPATSEPLREPGEGQALALSPPARTQAPAAREHRRAAAAVEPTRDRTRAQREPEGRSTTQPEAAVPHSQTSITALAPAVADTGADRTLALAAPRGEAAPAPPTPTRRPSRTVSTASAVRVHASEIQLCFERAQMEHAELHGDVLLRATLDRAGNVISAATSTLLEGGARLAACIRSAAQRWKFPAPADASSASISYKFVFE